MWVNNPISYYSSSYPNRQGLLRCPAGRYAAGTLRAILLGALKYFDEKPRTHTGRYAAGEAGAPTVRTVGCFAARPVA
jgi:hypothetical protein